MKEREEERWRKQRRTRGGRGIGIHGCMKGRMSRPFRWITVARRSLFISLAGSCLEERKQIGSHHASQSAARSHTDGCLEERDVCEGSACSQSLPPPPRVTAMRPRTGSSIRATMCDGFISGDFTTDLKMKVKRLFLTAVPSALTAAETPSRRTVDGSDRSVTAPMFHPCRCFRIYCWCKTSTPNEINSCLGIRNSDGRRFLSNTPAIEIVENVSTSLKKIYFCQLMKMWLKALDRWSWVDIFPVKRIFPKSR